MPDWGGQFAANVGWFAAGIVVDSLVWHFVWLRRQHRRECQK